MAKLAILSGKTGKSIKVFIQDKSQANVAGLTGLVFNSAGLTAYYIREGDATPTAMTLVTASVGTWTSLGFKEVDSVHMPGIYELGLPNAALASGDVVVYLQGAVNMAVTIIEIQTSGSPIDLEQPIAAAGWAATLQGALNAALATTAGKWTQIGTVFTIYCAQDEATVFRAFNLDSATNPQNRA